MNEQRANAPAGETCLVCARNDFAVPLIGFVYRGVRRYVCTEHLPILIHDAERLADRLDGDPRATPARDSGD